MSELLSRKVAIVTGGVSGIGRAIVERYIAEGAQVVVADINDRLAQEVMSGFGDAAHYVHTDVTDEDAVSHLVDAAVERFGRLDIMVNNAGASGSQASLLELTPADLDGAVALLVRSVMLGHKYAGLQFQRQGGGGAIVSTASIAGIEGGWGRVAYTTAKHAVVGVVHHAAAELSPFGIRTNAIAPGSILTELLPRTYGVPAEHAGAFLEIMRRDLSPMQPMHRFGIPEDVAGVAVFLGSDLSSYVNGVILPVDGGMTAFTQSSYRRDAIQTAQEFIAGLGDR